MVTILCPVRDFVSQLTAVDEVWHMLAADGLGYWKEEANHNLDNNQWPQDVMAPSIVNG